MDTQQSTEANPMQQIGNINEMNLENIFNVDKNASNMTVTTQQSNTSRAKAQNEAAPQNRLSYQNYCAVT